MSLTNLLTQTVDIVTIAKTGTDGLNNPIYGETDRATVKARLTSKSVDVHVAGRFTTVTTYRLYVAAGTAIDARSLVEYDGDTYRLVGAPHIARKPSGPHHIWAELELVTEQAS